MKKFNPLLDKKQTTNQITASVDDVMAPLSPKSGRPMRLAKCRDVPVWIDTQDRLIIPHKKV